MNSPLLNAQEAGELLAVPPSWLLAQARDDRVPHVRLGRYVRFNRDDLAAWIDTRTRGPRSQPPRGAEPAPTRADLHAASRRNMAARGVKGGWAA